MFYPDDGVNVKTSKTLDFLSRTKFSWSVGRSAQHTRSSFRVRDICPLKPRSRHASSLAVCPLPTPEISASGREYPPTQYLTFRRGDVPYFFSLNSSFSTRPLDINIHSQSLTIPHFPSLMIAMSNLHISPLLSTQLRNLSSYLFPPDDNAD
jgi:hypothetical protein